MKKMVRSRMLIFALFSGVILASGCATAPRIAMPHQIVATKPIMANTGKFMSPYTSDGVMAEWTDKALNAKMGAAVGSFIGVQVGQKVLEQIPFVGGFIGQKIGNAAGRAIAVKAAGGMEFIRKTSDMSFDSTEDMAVYLYVKHSSHEHYQDALSAAMEIYPELKKTYSPSLVKASRRVLQ